MKKEKIALVTGASSGIGKEFAIQLSKMGYKVVLVARRKDALEDTAKKCDGESIIFPCDLTKEEERLTLFKAFPKVDFLINNAGFGLFGSFGNNSWEKEAQLLNTNILAFTHLLHFYLSKMKDAHEGKIINVASIAGFLPGPLMSTYYASKNYVVRLSEAILEELHQEKSPVQIAILCPGPVNTEFNEIAGVHFALKGVSASYVVKYALKKFSQKKFYLFPSLKIKLAHLGTKICPVFLLRKVAYRIQKKKK